MNELLAQIVLIASTALSLNHRTFPDDVEWWQPAPHYSYDCYAADIGLAAEGYPDGFTASQLRAVAQKFIDARDVKGDMPISLDQDGYADSWKGCAGGSRPTGDPAWYVPSLVRLAQEKDGDGSFFAANATALDLALSRIPIDKETGLVFVNPSAPWLPWGFHDAVLTTGDDLMGSLLYRQAALDLAWLYGQGGNEKKAASWSSAAAGAASNLYRLCDKSSGMYLAASGQNAQIDILGSALAVYSGAITGDDADSVGKWLLDHPEMRVNGFVRQSPTNWAVTINSECGWGVGNYDDGAWAVGDGWVFSALYRADQQAALQFAEGWTKGDDPTMEWYGSTTTGFTGNLVSTTGLVRAMGDVHLSSPSRKPGFGRSSRRLR